MDQVPVLTLQEIVLRVGDLRLPPDEDPEQVAGAICQIEGVSGVDWRS